MNNVIATATSMTESGEVLLDEVKRVCMVRHGEDPGYVEYVLRPLIGCGVFVLSSDEAGQKLLSSNKEKNALLQDIKAEVEADDILCMRPAS